MWVKTSLQNLQKSAIGQALELRHNTDLKNVSYTHPILEYTHFMNTVHTHTNTARGLVLFPVPVEGGQALY